MTIDDAVIETSLGTVRGTDDGRVKAWKGIHHAASPVGDLRFRAPEPPETWTEVAGASTFGPACAQSPLGSILIGLGAAQGKDWLTLTLVDTLGHRGR